jgi:hypothetical protein
MNRSRRILTSLGFALALAATVPACVVSGQARVRTRGAVVITEAPPPPQEERIEVRSGYVWVRGRWDWQGRWVWVPGHWERERAGYMWSDGRWEQRNNQWVWVEGEWRTGGAHGTVTVHDPGPGPDVRDHRDERPDVRDHRDGGGGTTVVVVNDGRPRQPPPALQAENPGNKRGYIWISGRWDWQSGNWVWVPGHWERAKAKHRWRAGEWRLDGDVYIWVDGGWEKEDDERPRVRDHR